MTPFSTSFGGGVAFGTLFDGLGEANNLKEEIENNPVVAVVKWHPAIDYL